MEAKNFNVEHSTDVGSTHSERMLVGSEGKPCLGSSLMEFFISQAEYLLRDVKMLARKSSN